MTDDLRTRIAAVQQAHHIRIDPNHPAYGYCMCGFNPDADEDDFWWVAHAKHVADAVISVVQPLLEAEYNRGYDEGVDWLHDESRWIKGEDTDDASS